MAGRTVSAAAAVSSRRVMLAAYFSGHALDGLGTEVYTTVFGDQRPDVRNEKLFGRILLDVFELEVGEFLKGRF